MPDVTPPQSQTKSTEAPPPEDGWRPDLAALRARLDELDDKIHDLLMDRARVVESVARSGKAAAFRPGREAAILRRLLARHTGKLPARTLVRMWREMLAGTTAMQTAVTVAAYDPIQHGPTQEGTMTAIAREHFGYLTPVLGHASPEAALDALRAGVVTVAVLPFPAGAAAWWPALTTGEPRLHIIARLPFWAERPDNVPGADALVVGTTAPDASGTDRAFIALAQASDRAHLADVGLTPRATYGTVIEVDGLVADDDPRLHDPRLAPGAIALGGYAIPVAGDHA